MYKFIIQCRNLNINTLKAGNTQIRNYQTMKNAQKIWDFIFTMYKFIIQCRNLNINTLKAGNTQIRNYQTMKNAQKKSEILKYGLKINYISTNFWSVTFQTHYFWPNANTIEMIFCLYMCILMGKRLAVFLNSFLLLQSFGG